MGETKRLGVQLPEGTSGSALLHQLLSGAADRHPDVFGGAELLGDARRFRGGFAEPLVQFEVRRAASERRVEIAREILSEAEESFRFVGARGDEPLSEHLARPATALPLEELRMLGAGRLTPRIDHQGRSYVSHGIADLADELLARAHATHAAHGALRWLAEGFSDEQIDLSGRRFAVLGAGAELSPVPLLLEAGADVLWLDVDAPPEGLAKDSQLSGRLFFPRCGADILERPGEIKATIAAFADGAPLHVGLFAYAPGSSREWRLAAAMNAIVRSLPAGTVESLCLFVSPTSPAVVQKEDQEAAARGLAEAPLWQRALRGLGRLPDGHARHPGACVSRAIVPIQGASYQAAQYLAKILAAEVWAIHGGDLTGSGASVPLRVSANTAAITRTRSLSTPIFEAGFIGAPAFGVDTLLPETTRWLNGLLVLHDLLADEGTRTEPAASDAERARRLHSRQVHGGIYALPYALDAAITAAALLGFGRRPRLLVDALRG